MGAQQRTKETWRSSENPSILRKAQNQASLLHFPVHSGEVEALSSAHQQSHCLPGSDGHVDARLDSCARAETEAPVGLLCSIEEVHSMLS